MNLNSGMTIRFPAALRERLDGVAANSGLKPSDLIRIAVEIYVDKARETGRIEIPLILNDAPSATPLPEAKHVKYAPKKAAQPKAKKPKP